MRLKNILIVVTDIEKSKAFYKELFGLEVVVDFDGNVILMEGLVLQDKAIWEKFLDRQVIYGGNDAELYFIENDMDAFLNKLDNCSFEIEYIDRCREHDWGQRVTRIYDPDHHVIEIGEDLDYVARRFLKAGMTPEETARKTQLPLSQVEILAAEGENLNEGDV